ncbi:NADPH-dependent FMN reductase [Stappia sp. TSB10GB4]|uniref:NADPH-dependent FMN reductase n=1 Tax=Stappia sp. TSB10GB4 TaxID=2003584 RepID=UPI001648311E|nr:NAD(P)H-dependent oxidoreductase [Stappia sp. TSB10GB4]
MKDVRILILSGSIRTGSYNTKLAALAAKTAAMADAKVTQISLADYPLPIYDGDLEADTGVPENARKLKAVFQQHNGVFIASPEYNTAVTPLLKNTLDWVSRLSDKGEPPAAAFRNRVFALGAASIGALGGIRGLIGLRTILEIGLGALVIPNMATVPNAASAFDSHGHLTNERTAGLLQETIARLIEEVKLRG